MKPLGEFDQEYSDQMTEACLNAIVETAHDKATNTAVLRNAEIYRALLTLMATFLATSEAASTPRGVRLICEDFQKDLARRIANYRADMQAHGMPFTASEFRGYQ